MRIDAAHNLQAAAAAGSKAAAANPGAGMDPRRATSPLEAAKQFEEVLVREFVRTMTKDLFSGSLAGEGGAGWVKAQGEHQADALNDVLTKHLVESGTLGITDMLLQKWGASGSAGQLGRTFELDGAPPLSLEQFLHLRQEDTK